MPIVYLQLFYEFIKIGLFTFGGGYAALPFLYYISDVYNWFSQTELTQLIAISGITPGPIGLNMATFAGFKTLGVIGALISSIALILPMILITSQVYRLYSKFCENNCVKSILYVLRPTSCALISAVGIKLFYNLVYIPKDCIAFVLIIFLFILTFRLSRNPVIYLGIAGAFGIFYFLVKA